MLPTVPLAASIFRTRNPWLQRAYQRAAVAFVLALSGCDAIGPFSAAAIATRAGACGKDLADARTLNVLANGDQAPAALAPLRNGSMLLALMSVTDTQQGPYQGDVHLLVVDESAASFGPCDRNKPEVFENRTRPAVVGSSEAQGSGLLTVWREQNGRKILEAHGLRENGCPSSASSADIAEEGSDVDVFSPRLLRISSNRVLAIWRTVSHARIPEVLVRARLIEVGPVIYALPQHDPHDENRIVSTTVTLLKADTLVAAWDASLEQDELLVAFRDNTAAGISSLRLVAFDSALSKVSHEQTLRTVAGFCSADATTPRCGLRLVVQGDHGMIAWAEPRDGTQRVVALAIERRAQRWQFASVQDAAPSEAPVIQGDPTVAHLSGRRYLIAWAESNREAETLGVRARVLHSDGHPTFNTNTCDEGSFPLVPGLTGGQSQPLLGTTDSGSILVTWTDTSGDLQDRSGTSAAGLMIAPSALIP